MLGRAAVSLAAALAIGTAACTNLSSPGHFEPRLVRDDGPVAHPLASYAPRWRHAGNDPDVARRFAADFDAQLAAARLPTTLSASVAALTLDGVVDCAVVDANGLAGPAAGGPHVILWAVLALVGVPTDWVTVRARLVLVAKDATTGVALHTWDTGDVEETAVAGLYYWPAPMEAALRVAADRLEAELRSTLPAVEARVRALDTWQAAQDRHDDGLEVALEDPDVARRARALVTIARLGPRGRGHAAAVLARATDAEPRVRGHVLSTLDALGVHDPLALATVAALQRDPELEVRDRAFALGPRMRTRALAAELSDPEVSSQVEALADARSAARIDALHALERLGTRARPASAVVARALAQATQADEALAAIAALRALGQLDDEVREALADRAQGLGDEARAATLALEQLAVVERRPSAAAPSATAPAPASAPTRPVVAVFELEGGGLSSSDRAELTALLAAHLTATALFQVVPHGRILAELQRQKADSYRACFDSACQIEVGKAIAAEKVLSTQILRRARGCVVSATLYDLRTEATEHAAVVEGACSPQALGATLREVAARLRPVP